MTLDIEYTKENPEKTTGSAPFGTEISTQEAINVLRKSIDAWVDGITATPSKIIQNGWRWRGEESRGDFVHKQMVLVPAIVGTLLLGAHLGSNVSPLIGGFINAISYAMILALYLPTLIRRGRDAGAPAWAYGSVIAASIMAATFGSTGIGPWLLAFACCLLPAGAPQKPRREASFG